MQDRPFNKKQNTVSFFGLFGVLILFYIVELIDLIIFQGSLDTLGIYPRTLFGLKGIPLMPFLHGGFGHLFANSLPFLVLGYIVLKGEKSRFLEASVVIVLVGGLGTWLIGRPSYHIGVSGLIYGYFGYVMARGLYEKNLKWIIIAVLTGVFFGGMIFGVIPSGKSPVSWEGHLTGMLVGFFYGKKRSRRSIAQYKASSKVIDI